VVDLGLCGVSGSVKAASRWQRGVSTRDEVDDRLGALDVLRRWLDMHRGQLLDVLSCLS
jgi:hypothetical protein